MAKWCIGAVLILVPLLLLVGRTKGDDRSYSDLYMRRVAKQEGMLEVEPNTLYVRQVKMGNGPNLTAQDVGTFHVKCRALNGDCLVDTYRSGRPIAQDMRIAVEGFREGVVGMQEGERRLLYFHPDFGAKLFRLKEPKTPLIVEAELVQIERG